MCDDEDIERAYFRYDGIHYANGDYQPFIPELSPPKPEVVKPSIVLAEVNKVFEQIMLKNIPKIFESDDLFYKFLK